MTKITQSLATLATTVAVLAPVAMHAAPASAAQPKATPAHSVVCAEGEHKTSTKTDSKGVTHTHKFTCDAHEQWIERL